MRFSLTTALVIVCLQFTQVTPLASPQVVQSSSIIIAAQTVIPLTLVNPIKNKSTKPGDSVRALVAFPVTVGDRLAVPAGTYVEGTLLPPLPRVKHQPDPGTQLHFTRLVFANGYTLPLDATQAKTLPPLSPADALTSSLISRGVVFLAEYYGGQTGPTETLPPLHTSGPGPAVIVGATLGGVAAIIVVGLLGHRKVADSDFIVHDAGWQFQMKLTAPLSVDPGLALIAAAAK